MINNPDNSIVSRGKETDLEVSIFLYSLPFRPADLFDTFLNVIML